MQSPQHHFTTSPPHHLTTIGTQYQPMPSLLLCLYHVLTNAQLAQSMLLAVLHRPGVRRPLRHIQPITPSAARLRRSHLPSPACSRRPLAIVVSTPPLNSLISPSCTRSPNPTFSRGSPLLLLFSRRSSLFSSCSSSSPPSYLFHRLYLDTRLLQSPCPPIENAPPSRPCPPSPAPPFPLRRSADPLAPSRPTLSFIVRPPALLFCATTTRVACWSAIPRRLLPLDPTLRILLVAINSCTTPTAVATPFISPQPSWVDR